MTLYYIKAKLKGYCTTYCNKFKIENHVIISSVFILKFVIYGTK